MDAIKIAQMFLLQVTQKGLIAPIYLTRNSKYTSNLDVNMMFHILIGTYGCYDTETRKEEGEDVMWMQPK